VVPETLESIRAARWPVPGRLIDVVASASPSTEPPSVRVSKLARLSRDLDRLGARLRERERCVCECVIEIHRFFLKIKNMGQNKK
jgi:hypothetical protein